MSTAERDPILELAAKVADATAVDWDTWRRKRPDLTPRVDSLALIARIAAAHRDALEDAPSTRRPTTAAPAFRWGPLLAYEKIGSGSFGEVYRALDPRLDREVALKLRTLGEERGLDARRFLEEARHLARVQHPHVVAVYGADIDGGRAGIWTELVTGSTLEDALADGPLDAARVLKIGRQLCAAVSAVHAEGMIHGDITARNVLLDRAGAVRLTDFGCATPWSEALAALIGTPLATAPEVLAGEPVTPFADLYSIAALLHRLATGAHPVEAATVAELMEFHRTGRRPPTAARFPSVPVDLARAIDRGLEPLPADRFVSAVAFDEALACAEAAAGSAERAAPRSGMLPATLTSFVGREAERARIEDAFRSFRWVSLVGPGGGGKTRLAIEAARERGALYPDGVWFVSLANLEPGQGVAREIAEVLGVREGGEAGRQLIEHVRSWRALIVLDNCEHVLDDAADIGVRLVEGAPRLHLLATSREPVDVEGEAVIDLGGLPLPPEDADPGGDDAPSVRLLADRLRAIGRDFRRDGPRVLHDLVRLADGLPLAIELIAAAARNTNPRDLLAELSAGLPDLRGRRGAAPRHASLEDVVAWTYGRLRPPAKRVLARLSVFRGGATLEGIRALCEGLDAEVVAASLQELERVSLALSEDDAPRWRLLEPIRQFAERRLADSGDLDAARDAHLDFFASAAAAPPRDDREVFARYLATMPRERDNIRAAVCWAAADESRHRAGRRLVAALDPLWADGRPDYRLVAELGTLVGRGPFEDAGHLIALRRLAAVRWATGDRSGVLELLQKGLAAATSLGDVALRARFEMMLVTRLTGAGELSQAEGLIDTMLAHAEASGDPYLIAQAKRSHAGLLLFTGDLTRAGGLARESEEACRTTGDFPGVYFAAALAARLAHTSGENRKAAVHEERSLEALSSMSDADPRLHAATRNSLAVYLSLSGDKTRAMQLYRESLAISRRHGFRSLEANTLANMGEEARLQGDLDRAIVLLRESAAILDEVTEPATRTSAYTSLGIALADKGEHDSAREALSVGLDDALKLGSRECTTALFLRAQVAASSGSPVLAARLLGAAERLAREAHMAERFAAGDDVARLRVDLRESLGVDGFDQERQIGGKLHHDDAVALARTVPEPAQH